MTRDWDRTLRDFLGRVGDDPRPLDDDDRAAICVLLSLLRAVQGEHSLLDLSVACIDADDAGRRDAEARMPRHLRRVLQ